MKRSQFWRRRRLVITPDFQWPIVLKTLLLSALVSTIFAWATFYFLWKSSITSGQPSLSGFLFQPGLWVGWGICLLGCLLVSGILMLRVTHRVAGQMYRFEKTLDQVLRGNGTKTILTRKNDYFHELEADLNQYLNLEN